MAALAVRQWFRYELRAWDAAHPAPDPLSAVYVETINLDPDPATIGAQWSTLVFASSNSERVAIGPAECKRWRESGDAQVVVAARAGIGDDLVLQIAEAMRANLRERYDLGGHFRTLDPQPPSTPADASGRWFYSFVNVPYQFDY